MVSAAGAGALDAVVILAVIPVVALLSWVDDLVAAVPAGSAVRAAPIPVQRVAVVTYLAPVQVQLTVAAALIRLAVRAAPVTAELIAVVTHLSQLGLDEGVPTLAAGCDAGRPIGGAHRPLRADEPEGAARALGLAAGEG
jgi:hypothetical protein